ncbi:MAG: ATPase, T2SS/T4P/T4SS family [Caulobacteraceae bacterium]
MLQTNEWKYNKQNVDRLSHYLEFDSFYKQIEKNINDFLHKPPETNQEAEIIRILKDYKENSTKGDNESRKVMKEHIRTLLLNGFTVYEINDAGEPVNNLLYEKVYISDNNSFIEYIIPFEKPEQLTPVEKFEIILYKNSKKSVSGMDSAFKEVLRKYPFYHKVRELNDYISNNYEYDESDIADIYNRENVHLTFRDKVEVLTQRIYEEVYGLKSLDMLAYSDVNEVGFSYSGEYVYCWCDIKIWLSFIKLSENQARVVQDKAISFDKNIGQLDISNPEKLCHRADGARITVTQFPYSSARNICIRNFNQSHSSFGELIQLNKLRALMVAMVRMGKSICMQGGLGTGKTTTMEVMFEILDDYLHIGLVEDYFEQHIMKKYPYKRVVELQSINSKTLHDAVKTILRMSIDVAGLGECRDGNALYAFIQLVQSVSVAAWFTTHINRPETTIPRLKNLAMSTGIYSTEQSAVMDLIHNINIIFQHEIIDNKRQITKVVEVEPLVETHFAYGDNLTMDTELERLEKLYYIQHIQNNTSNMYRLNTLMEIRDGELKFVNYPSQRLINDANRNKSNMEYLNKLLEIMEADIKSPCIR